MANEERDKAMLMTVDHTKRVAALLAGVMHNIALRAANHDRSKFTPDEWPLFVEATAKLKGMTYGSDEYQAALAELKPSLDHHYAYNSHHPEHYTLWKCQLCSAIHDDKDAPVSQCYGNGDIRMCPHCCMYGSIMEAMLEPHVGLEGMDLIDLIEMLADWKAATERHADGSLSKSFEVNRSRFNINSSVEMIMRNTAQRLGWLESEAANG